MVRFRAGWAAGLLVMLALLVLSPAQMMVETASPPRVDSLVPARATQGERVSVQVFGWNLIMVHEAQLVELRRAASADSGLVLERPVIRRRITALTKLHIGDIVSDSMYIQGEFLRTVVTIPADVPSGFKDIAVMLGKETLATRPAGFEVRVQPRAELRLLNPLATVIAGGDSPFAAVTVRYEAIGQGFPARLGIRPGSGADGCTLIIDYRKGVEEKVFSCTLALAGVLPGMKDSVVFELIPPVGIPGDRAHRAVASFEIPGRPDLAVSILAVPQARAAELVVAVKVENQGTETAGSSTVRVSSDDPALKQVSSDLAGLRPGQSSTDTLRFAIPEAARGRNIELTAFATPVPGETDTSNNRETVAISLMAGAIPPARDTVVRRSETPVTPGTTLSQTEEEQDESSPFPPLVLIAVAGVAMVALVSWLIIRVVQAGAGQRIPGRTPAPGEKPAPDSSRAGTGPGSLPPGAAGVKGKLKEDVLFSVTAPGEVTARDPFLVNVWAHLDAQRDEVLARARQAQPDSRVSIQSEGPFAIERNTELELVLTVQDCMVEPRAKRIRWTGAIANAGFQARLADRATEGVKAGRVSVQCQGFEVASVPFTVRLVAALSGAAPAEATGRVHRRAFASYAREDAVVVLSCIQGMGKVIPGLKVFVDVLNLRSGEYWESRLQQEILASDVFYLFWSGAAAESEWVDKEWRFGYAQKGGDFIDPVPLVPEDKAPVPTELKGRHFGDKLIYVREYFKTSGPGANASGTG